jgi:hypothetical protein
MLDYGSHWNEQLLPNLSEQDNQNEDKSRVPGTTGTNWTTITGTILSLVLKFWSIKVLTRRFISPLWDGQQRNEWVSNLPGLLLIHSTNIESGTETRSLSSAERP